MSRSIDGKIYVGGLPNDATSQELEDVFYRYGQIRKVWVARRPPGFAFIEFDDPRDAEDAVRALDGTRICGVRARVELSHGRRRNEFPSRGRSRSRSPHYRHSRSPRGSPRYDDTESRRSRSPSRSRSRTRTPPTRTSPSRSRSRSMSR